MSDTIDNAQLYAACRHNNSPEQTQAFTILWNYLYRITYAMVHNRTDPEALATECTQQALIKIHRNLEQCHSPGQFRSWAAQVARRTVIDELRKSVHTRRATLTEDSATISQTEALPLPQGTHDLSTLLHTVITEGPLSERSQRVVLGRYFDEQTDETLAQRESSQSGKTVLPSHIQVTRAKNLAKLRTDMALLEQLRDFIQD
ncbi:MAG: sigma-70 family RNA polymerase sigma factor [Chloroflexota bacterium]